MMSQFDHFSEIQNFFHFQRRSNVNMMADCVLCFSPIVKHSDRNLVQGRSEFKVDKENLFTRVCCIFHNAMYL